MSILPRAPPLPTGKKFHVYLSYLWGDGQALPVALKCVLQLSARGIRVFLDLDDLKDINALEAYIDASAVCVCLVSPMFRSPGFPGFPYQSTVSFLSLEGCPVPSPSPAPLERLLLGRVESPARLRERALIWGGDGGDGVTSFSDPAGAPKPGAEGPD